LVDTVRATFLTGYVDLARTVGLDPLRMLDRANIPRVALAQPDLRLPATAGRDLLEASGVAAEDFGLRLSELRTISVLGPVTLVAREQPTVRAVIHALTRYVGLQYAATRIRLEERNDFAIVQLSLWHPTPGPARQATELCMAQLLRVLRIPLGPGWWPERAALAHSAPRSLETHHRVLGPNLDFNQDFNGFVFGRAELDQLNPSADPAMAKEAQRYVEGLISTSRASLPEKVSELAETLLPMGHCTIDFVARQMAVEPRTLQRQLAEQGTSFLDIVQSTRMGLVPQYLEQNDRPLVEVADLLGFSALSAFSRWHKAQYGRSATTHRQALRLLAPA
jgi:AraC-like DNA-binding protein